jgi:pimeloyl-ACP methyl ester carboxylesterase
MRLLLTLALLLLSTQAEAKSGFVKLADGHEVFVDHQPAKSGKTTFVLVNGLVYNMNRWNDFTAPLAKEGYGIVRYYFRGQMHTLRKELEKGKPEFFSKGLDPEVMADELKGVMDALKLRKAVIVGLSYGAGIAAEFGEKYPERVDQLLFQAPLVVSLDSYDPQGAWIKWNLDYARIFWGPLWGPYVYDYYYNYIYRSYMSQRIVPERIPPEMQDIPEEYKEAVFHQVRAMRDFDLRSYRYSKLKGQVHFMLASEEEVPAMKDQFRAWNGFDAKSLGSLIYFTPSWHAIPDAIGAQAAAIAKMIVSKDAKFQGGKVYSMNVETGKVATYRDARELEKKALEKR